MVCIRVVQAQKKISVQPARSHTLAGWYTNSKNDFGFKISPKANLRELLKVLASQPQRPKIKVIESKKFFNKNHLYIDQ